VVPEIGYGAPGPEVPPRHPRPAPRVPPRQPGAAPRVPGRHPAFRPRASLSSPGAARGTRARQLGCRARHPGCRGPGAAGGRDAMEIHISSVSRAYLGSNLLVASSRLELVKAGLAHRALRWLSTARCARRALLPGAPSALRRRASRGCCRRRCSRAPPPRRSGLRVCVIKLPKGFALEVKVKSQNARVVGDLNLSLRASPAGGPLKPPLRALLAALSLWPLALLWVPSCLKRP